MTLILLTIIALLIILTIPGWIRKIRLWHWKRSLNLKRHQTAFQTLFTNMNGFELSKKARLTGDAFEYTYGEIEFIPFIALIAMTKPTPHTRFYDLGCGTGKAVISCATVFEMGHYCGIELFKELSDAALTQKIRLAQLPAYETRAKKITFIHDNFLNTDLSEATLIFINATALIGPTWELLNEKLSKTPPGTIVITTTKKLISTAFYVTNRTKVEMSWGITVAYIHRSI
jgi:precorrin-6B methylase 2